MTTHVLRYLPLRYTSGLYPVARALFRSAALLCFSLIWLMSSTVLTRVAAEQPLPGFGEQHFGHYIQWLQDNAQEREIPGFAVAVVSPQEIIDVHTWGVGNVKDGQPVDEQTLFRIASVSKTFAGTVAAQLVHHNIFSWDDAIADILPDYQISPDANYTKQLTLRHVMSHTTGLVTHAYSNLLDAGVPYNDIRDKLREVPAVCAPGNCYAYQNVVFSLIADALQARLETRYEDFVRENIFLPLGMRQASMSYEAFVNNPNASAPHVRARGQWHATSINPAYFSVGPAAGVNATITDMALWAQAHLGGFPDVLPPSVLEAQHTPVVETPWGNYFNRWPRTQKAYYGLGWRVMDYAGVRIIHHGGAVRGYRAEIVLVPEYDRAMVVLFNASTSLANDVVPVFLDELLAHQLADNMVD